MLRHAGSLSPGLDNDRLRGLLFELFSVEFEAGAYLALFRLPLARLSLTPRPGDQMVFLAGE